MGERIRYKGFGNNATIPCWFSINTMRGMEDSYVAAYYVTKGPRLLVNAWKLHRDPNTWTDRVSSNHRDF
ncbi:hypothetical protein RJ639_039774 [Escallonia herrerae]|uniref:Uncharacterized protein n=1 Tax=Escallonia herrerae TaxID=1293975 RepID=A0AA89B671_9ASTE|nr:hypothetical protein RJ639_039774 [Escallonia herrerae]